MKKLLITGLLIFLLATTFQSDNPPGWYQQSLPVNDFINDIFFLDSLNGWVATFGTSNDTAYILQTTNGGESWNIINTSFRYYSKLQFLNRDTGYASGAPGGIWRTINGGVNWNPYNNGLPFGIDDMQFINFDTGWVCSSDPDFGGIWKTTDGGNNWIRQLSPPPIPTLSIKAISILNNDTGWAINSSSVRELYRTTNGGLNWIVQFTFGGQLNDILFLNKDIGIISGGVNFRTTNGGFNWIQSNDGGIKISFSDDSVGWTGNNFNTIQKTINGGINWFRQTTNTSNPTPFALSPLNSWAGGIKLIHTTDGGGLLSVSENNIEANSFTLYQNYPNPFNPKTIINYELRITNHVTLKIFDIHGKDVTTLVNEKQNAGNYKIEFDGSALSSGVYFYRIDVSNERGKEIHSETKKMILVR